MFEVNIIQFLVVVVQIFIYSAATVLCLRFEVLTVFRCIQFSMLAKDDLNSLSCFQMKRSDVSYLITLKKLLAV